MCFSPHLGDLVHLSASEVQSELYLDDLFSTNSSDVTLLLLSSSKMSQSPPLTGLRVLEFAGLAPGELSGSIWKI
jgi:hypothetical protein